MPGLDLMKMKWMWNWIELKLIRNLTQLYGETLIKLLESWKIFFHGLNIGRGCLGYFRKYSALRYMIKIFSDTSLAYNTESSIAIKQWRLNILVTWYKVRQKILYWASPVAQLVQTSPTMRETRVQSLGFEDPLEKGMTTCSSILAWRILWTVKSMGLQSRILMTWYKVR